MGRPSGVRGRPDVNFAAAFGHSNRDHDRPGAPVSGAGRPATQPAHDTPSGKSLLQYEINHIVRSAHTPALKDSYEADAEQQAQSIPMPLWPYDLPARDNAPLPGPVQTFYQSIAGADLSRVRVHTGPQANASAGALGARAYTEGDDIVFGDGQYALDRPEGVRLLAHELAHVAQNERGAPRARRFQPLPGGAGGLTADDVVVRNAPPHAPIPVSEDPLSRFPTIAAALDTETYQRLQQIIRQYRPYEPMAEGMHGVACPVGRLLALDARPVPTGTLASAILPYLLDRSSPPAMLALIMRNETLRRFMAANYPAATATVSIEIQPLLGPPRPRPHRTHGTAPGASATAEPSVAIPELIFVLKKRTFAISDGLLHLDELDEAAGGQIANIANGVVRDVGQLTDHASHILSGREAAARLPALAGQIMVRPSDFALADVRELQSETASLVSALQDLAGNQAVPELNHEAAALVADVRTAQAGLENAVSIVSRLHERTAVGSTTDETADYLQRESEDLHSRGHHIGSILMARESARFRVHSKLLDLLTGGAISDMDQSLQQYRAGKISLSAYHSLVRHAVIKAGIAITVSVAAGMVGGWAGGLAGRAIFGAGTLGMSMTAGFGGGLAGGVGFVGTQDIYSLTTAALSSDPYVQARMQASLHSGRDYLIAGGLGGVMGMAAGGLLHTPAPASASTQLGATGSITLLDASGRPIRIAGGQIVEWPSSRGPILLGPDGQPLGAAMTSPPPTLFDASGRPVLSQAPGGATTTLTGQSRLAGPHGSPLGGGPAGGVPPILVDAQGRPLAAPSSHHGPVIVDLQSGTTSFLDEMLTQTPGARGIGVESGRWLLGYQGIHPTVPGDLDLALGVVRRSPIWPDTPAWRTPMGQLPRLLPWEIDPAATLFPASGPVVVRPEPFFPATGGEGRLVPFNIRDIPPGGIHPTTHPALHGIADQVYLRRPFGLAFADPATTQQLGQELNRMLKPGGFVELRLRVQAELSAPATGTEGADQVATIAAQIEGARVVRVDQGAIKRFQSKGRLPPDPQQAAVLQNAASDIRGLGEGSYARIIRIYKGQ